MLDIGRAIATGFICSLIGLSVYMKESSTLIIILGFSVVGFIWLPTFNRVERSSK